MSIRRDTLILSRLNLPYKRNYFATMSVAQRPMIITVANENIREIETFLV